MIFGLPLCSLIIVLTLTTSQSAWLYMRLSLINNVSCIMSLCQWIYSICNNVWFYYSFFKIFFTLHPQAKVKKENRSHFTLRRKNMSFRTVRYRTVPYFLTQQLTLLWRLSVIDTYVVLSKNNRIRSFPIRRPQNVRRESPFDTIMYYSVYFYWDTVIQYKCICTEILSIRVRIKYTHNTHSVS